MAWSRAWAGLGAGPNPPDPRPHGSSHIPGTPPQGLLRPAGSARAQKGREGVRWRMLRALGTRGGQTRAQSLGWGCLACSSLREEGRGTEGEGEDRR